MSVARITTITFNSKEAADIAKESYVENSPNDFPEAEQLLGIQADGNILIAVSLYADNEAMERATAARKKALDSNEEVVSVDTKVGTVEINHTN
jgi:hypothetical protein